MPGEQLHPWDNPNNLAGYSGPVFPAGGVNPYDYGFRHDYEIAKGAYAEQRNYAAFQSSLAALTLHHAPARVVSLRHDYADVLDSYRSEIMEEQIASINASGLEKGTVEPVSDALEKGYKKADEIIDSILSSDYPEDSLEEIEVERLIPNEEPGKEVEYVYVVKSELGWRLPGMIRPSWLLCSGEFVRDAYHSNAITEIRGLNESLPLVLKGLKLLHVKLLGKSIDKQTH